MRVADGRRRPRCGPAVPTNGSPRIPTRREILSLRGRATLRISPSEPALQRAIPPIPGKSPGREQTVLLRAIVARGQMFPPGRPAVAEHLRRKQNAERFGPTRKCLSDVSDAARAPRLRAVRRFCRTGTRPQMSRRHREFQIARQWGRIHRGFVVFGIRFVRPRADIQRIFDRSAVVHVASHGRRDVEVAGVVRSPGRASCDVVIVIGVTGEKMRSARLLPPLKGLQFRSGVADGRRHRHAQGVAVSVARGGIDRFGG